MDIFVYLTLCFTSLFTLMDPLGVMPVFLQMTDGMDTKERRYIALKACTIAFIILVLFTLSGRFLFHFFCILSFFILCASTPAFKNLGRDGKQCDDETDGTYSNGDRRGMFYQRDTSGIN